MPKDTHVAVASYEPEQAIFLRCEGPCTMGACPSIRAKVGERITEATKNLYVDLSKAANIDSTFAGFMLSMLRGQPGIQPLRLNLISPTPSVMRTLETMHVTRMINFVDHLPSDDVAWEPISLDLPDADQAADLIITCHENLIDADDRNRDTFGPVVDGFRAAREKRDPGD